MHDKQSLPPRVVIVMSDQWRRALLRAALRNVGDDAIGTRRIRESRLIRPSAAGRGPVRLIILDQDTLGSEPVSAVLALQQALGSTEIVLLARATVSPPD